LLLSGGLHAGKGRSHTAKELHGPVNKAIHFSPATHLLDIVPSLGTGFDEHHIQLLGLGLSLFNGYLSKG
jgi:hypothetical protein